MNGILLLRFVQSAHDGLVVVVAGLLLGVLLPELSLDGFEVLWSSTMHSLPGRGNLCQPGVLTFVCSPAWGITTWPGF